MWCALRYTFAGDANLDGIVNGTDFTLLAGNFNLSNRYWSQGDFNYDGKVNGLDFNATEQSVVEHTLALASGGIKEARYAAWLKAHAKRA